MTGKKFLAIAFFVIAGISFIFSLVCFNLYSTPTWGRQQEDYVTYGGDAYTGIQNATATTANNTYLLVSVADNIAEHIRTFAGLSFIIISLTFTSIGIYQLLQSMQKVPESTKETKPMRTTMVNTEIRKEEDNKQISYKKAESIKSEDNFVIIKCPNCGEELFFTNDLSTAECPHCGCNIKISQ